MPITNFPKISGIAKNNIKITINEKELRKTLSARGVMQPDILDLSTSKTKKKGLLATVATVFSTGIGATIKKHFQNSALNKIDKRFDALQQDLPRVKDTFQDVFMRKDIDTKETSAMLERYRDIEKLRVTRTKDDYIKALFKEAKKNFGFGDIDIPLHIDDVIDNSEKCAGSTKDLMNQGIHIKRNRTNMSHMNVIHHELRHEKQNYIAFNYDKEEYVKTAIKSVYKEAKSNKDDFLYDTVKNISFEQYYDDMQDAAKNDIYLIEKMYGKADKSKLSEKDCEFARKCLKAKESRVSGKVNYKAYKNNFLEKDAFHAGDTIDKLLG